MFDRGSEGVSPRTTQGGDAPGSGLAAEAALSPGRWKIRPAEAGDADAVAGLFERTFGKPASADWYRWKVLDAPWPLGAPAGWVATAGERVIGHYAATPMRFWLQEEELPVLHGCDVMTVPEFRRQGVLSRLADAANRAWSDAGAAFVIGLPTVQWGSRSAYVGYRTAFEIRWLWRPLRTAAVVPGRAGVAAPAVRAAAAPAVGVWNMVWSRVAGRAGRELSVERVQTPGPEFDELWLRLRNAYDATVVRDRAWVQYRYIAAPGARYELLLARRNGEPIGYVASRLVDSGSRRSGWIADLFAAPYDPGARAALLAAAVRSFREAGAHDARAFAAPGTPLWRSLVRAGFIPRKGGYAVALIPFSASLPWPILEDSTRWLFAAGDSDVL